MNAIYNALIGFTHDFLRRYPHDGMLQTPRPTVKKVLNVMSLDFTYKAAIRGYESVIIERQWNGIDKFTMILNSEVTNADLIGLDDVVWFDNEFHKAFIIERIDESLQGNTVEYTITGIGLSGLLKDFITVPPDLAYDVKAGTSEEIVRQWVENNIARNVYPIILGTYNGFGSSTTDQTRYKNLFDEINRVLLPDDLGQNLEIDITNNQLVFNVMQGADRTVDAPDYAPRVIFGLKYGNMAAYKRVVDKTSEKNYAYVGGDGEEAARNITAVIGAGSRRKEIFVDARDTNLESERIARGNQALSENIIIDGFEFEVMERQFKYENDYDLGDFVTVVLSISEYQNLQITSVIETYEKNNITTEIKFGKTDKTLISVFASINKKVNLLETR